MERVTPCSGRGANGGQPRGAGPVLSTHGQPGAGRCLPDARRQSPMGTWGGLATDSPSPGCDGLRQPPKAGARARGCSHTGLSLPEPAGGGSSHVQGTDGNPKPGRQETDPEVTTNTSCGQAKSQRKPFSGGSEHQLPPTPFHPQETRRLFVCHPRGRPRAQHRGPA